jgi:hypothetical protein
MTTTSVFQRMDKKNVELADAICASAESSMEIAEIQYLIDGLTKVRDIEAAKNSAKTQRINRMRAAQSDPKMRDIIVQTSAELKRIGFGDGVNNVKVGLTKLNDAMSAAKKEQGQRMTLKTACYAIGLID